MNNPITDAERERYERAVQGLDKAIYELTWLEKFFGGHGALTLEYARYHYLHLLDRRADALSAISSTYYAAAGSLRVSARNHWVFLKLVALVQGKYFFEHSFIFTQILIRDYGYDQLSTNKLDVAAHVFTRKKRYQQALECIGIVLARLDVTENNKALMYRLAADIHVAKRAYEQARGYIDLALALRDQVGPETVTRILRSEAALEDALLNHIRAALIRREISALDQTYGLPGQDRKSKANL